MGTGAGQALVSLYASYFCLWFNSPSHGLFLQEVFPAS